MDGVSSLPGWLALLCFRPTPGLRAQSGCPRILQTEKPARRRRRRRPPPEAEMFSGFKRFSTILPTFYSAIGPGTISVSGPRELNRACTPPSITYAGPRRRRQAGRRSEAKRPRKWQALHWLHVGKPHCQKITWAHVTHAAGHWRPFDKVQSPWHFVVHRDFEELWRPQPSVWSMTRLATCSCRI